MFKKLLSNEWVNEWMNSKTTGPGLKMSTDQGYWSERHRNENRTWSHNELLHIKIFRQHSMLKLWEAHMVLTLLRSCALFNIVSQFPQWGNYLWQITALPQLCMLVLGDRTVHSCWVKAWGVILYRRACGPLFSAYSAPLSLVFGLRVYFDLDPYPACL